MRSKIKRLSAILAAILLITTVIYFLWYRGVFLPGWIEWKEAQGSYLLGTEEAEIVLDNKILHVILNDSEIWRSETGYQVSEYVTGDVDHDGENELILLFWRHGSFKEHLPFWVEKNDNDWSQHIGVYDWKESYAYRLDPAWVSSRLGIQVAGIQMDQDGVVTLRASDGTETRWFWRTFGLSRLEDGEVPVLARKNEREQEKKLISFTASGDNLIHEAIYRAAKEKAEAEGREGYDFSFVYEEVAPFFQKHDINFINVESQISDQPPADYPYFSTPQECADALLTAGFNVFNLSNNHSYDQGTEGLQATEALWASKDGAFAFGLYDTGESPEIPILDYDGVKLAFLAYTYGTNGIETPQESNERVIYLSETDIIKEQLRHAREEADIVIVSAHFGTEGSHQITDSERALAKGLTEWGADLVIGTHPHVIKDAQWFDTSDGRRALVCYSLGNFISSMRKVGNLAGLTLECTFVCEAGRKVAIRNARLIPQVTVYGPYYREPHVKWLSDYSKEEAEQNREAYRDINYSFEKLVEIFRENVSTDFLSFEETG